MKAFLALPFLMAPTAQAGTVIYLHSAAAADLHASLRPRLTRNPGAVLHDPFAGYAFNSTTARNEAVL